MSFLDWRILQSIQLVSDFYNSNFNKNRLIIFANYPGNTSTCNSTYQALTGYVGTLVTLLNAKGFVVSGKFELFDSLRLQ
jgi:hypothetical protein